MCAFCSQDCGALQFVIAFYISGRKAPALNAPVLGNRNAMLVDTGGVLLDQRDG